MVKKIALFVLTFVMIIGLASCTGEPAEKTNLSVFFVPSRDNATLVQGISYLPELLKAEMATLGYDFETVSVYVGTSYEAVGEALDAGTADIGFIPGGTYAVYSDGENMDVALTATRGGLSKDFSDAKDWNDGVATVSDPEYQVTYYRSIGIVGQTTKGRELADIINGGGDITWEDLQDAKIGVQSVTSSAGRVYPSLLFNELYGHTLADLPAANVILVSGYGGAASALASGSVDIAFGYADFRRDYADEWISTEEGGYSQENTIWEDTDVVFVTEGVYNDTITVSKKTVDDDLQAAIEQAFINLVQDTTPLASPSGVFLMVKDIFTVYSHEGYRTADDSDYDVARAANLIVNG
ncbi:MAG: PhnD/SsuA/transferrin family substrate-binding protein [Firmicutes bacterium]|nr:PhnD/SsuA/transferrin family substrate-binding protein [Bacillota bacterium]